jgi:hypothetical protein
VRIDRTDWLDWVFAGARLGAGRRQDEWDLLLSVPEPLSLGYVTDAFERPLDLLGGYSDEELQGGLWFLLGDYGVLHPATDDLLPLADRLRAVRSVGTLFSELMTARCTPTLSHLDEPGSPLNSPCYMWWDLWLPGRSGPIPGTCLDVMEATLALDHDACRESALHGLGHFRSEGALAERCERILDRFLRGRRTLRPELALYAEAARAGCVL